MSAESSIPVSVVTEVSPGSEAVSTELVDLGQRLRAARQARGLQASELADRLRIGKEQLEALEAADLARLPEPVFVIAQVRRLAGALDLDLEPQLLTLRQSAWMGQASKVARPALTRPTPARTQTPGPAAARAAVPGTGSRSGPALPRIVGCGALVLAALWGIQDAWQGQRSPVTARSAPGPSPAARTLAGSTTPAVPPGSTATAQDSLSLRSTPPSWVEVRNKAGGSLFKGTLSGERRFPIGEGLQVLAGRPDLVWAASGANPGRPLGAISEVRWRSLP